MKKKKLKKKLKESFNMNEVRHLATNFAISCLNGYSRSFDEWYRRIYPKWRKTANQDDR